MKTDKIVHETTQNNTKQQKTVLSIARSAARKPWIVDERCHRDRFFRGFNVVLTISFTFLLHYVWQYIYWIVQHKLITPFEIVITMLD